VIKIYLLTNNCYLQHYDTNLARVDRDDIIQGYEVNKAALINSFKVNYLIWQEFSNANIIKQY
jgi:hypothetical protein